MAIRWAPAWELFQSPASRAGPCRSRSSEWSAGRASTETAASVDEGTSATAGAGRAQGYGGLALQGRGQFDGVGDRRLGRWRENRSSAAPPAWASAHSRRSGVRTAPSPRRDGAPGRRPRSVRPRSRPCATSRWRRRPAAGAPLVEPQQHRGASKLIHADVHRERGQGVELVLGQRGEDQLVQGDRDFAEVIEQQRRGVVLIDPYALARRTGMAIADRPAPIRQPGGRAPITPRSA